MKLYKLKGETFTHKEIEEAAERMKYWIGMCCDENACSGNCALCIFGCEEMEKYLNEIIL